ncbi:aminoacetone oxidase family FAD-binding enzyme [Marinomonas piezotolerans]|uniref:Aminoacetone oxidase family FAD-binding enzyme n=1 Tax=Marinomonas piezotolerans TaxID=2213058 RepID=A0A370UEI8_9GAMM|nr:NAD(P)/FAD-dependent oxidoreductase [Marinomonas piezotolerans]RDL46207.1 aminoacetone oxidase family FAD-binding enzyme [Marinomonas piezotolerans]
MQSYDVVIIGAGASGLFCAAQAGYRGRNVLVLDHANKAGKKILMSGGGRCNFTNMDAAPKHFLSQNPHFCISALRRYTPQDFVDLVDRHGLEYVEKAPGQLFCQHSAKDLLEILLTECEWAGADIRLNTSVDSVVSHGTGYQLTTSNGLIECESLVIATGGLSIPTMGASGFGYQIAEQFGLRVLSRRASLVPITIQPSMKETLSTLSGVSLDIEASANGMSFKEPMLFTHRGISGPSILQISNFWQPGEALQLNLLSDMNPIEHFKALRTDKPKRALETELNTLLPKRLVEVLKQDIAFLDKPMAELSNEQIKTLVQRLTDFDVQPNGTEGYRTAEVTLGGIDTDEVSSKTFESNKAKGLYFIGEVLDVTGWLGGYNFQFAWSSGFAAGQYV